MVDRIKWRELGGNQHDDVGRLSQNKCNFRPLSGKVGTPRFKGRKRYL